MEGKLEITPGAYADLVYWIVTIKKHELFSQKSNSIVAVVQAGKPFVTINCFLIDLISLCLVLN